MILFGLLAAQIAAEETTENVHKPNNEAVIKSSSEFAHPDGTYNYQFDTSNGISQSVVGVGGEYAQGSSTWIGRSGEPLTLTWHADRDGYRAEGFHLPTPPPIPFAIQRALEYLATKKPSADDV